MRADEFPEDKSLLQTGFSGQITPKTKGVTTRYRLVFLLFLLTAVAYLDRTNISIAGVSIRSQFKIDNTELGWLISAFLIGYATFQIPAGLLARRLGARRALTMAVLLWAFFSALTALVPSGVRGSLLMLVVIRFSLGGAEAMLFPASSQFVERWFPEQERGRANGIIFAGVGTGSGLTPPLVTEIILHFGWRAAFWFSAMVEVVIATVWYRAARDAPEKYPLISAAELELIQQGREEQNEIAAGRQTVPWARIFRSKEVLALTASYFACGYVAWLFFGWFYIYLAQVRGLNLRTSAAYSMVPFIAMTVGCLCGGVLSDWITRRFNLRAGRCLLPVAALALTGAFLVMGSRAPQAGAASILLACGAACLYLSTNCYWAVAADISGEFTGVVSGIMNVGAQLGGACTASLTPLVASRCGWEMSFYVAALLSMMGALAWLLVDPKRRLFGAGIMG
jgi:MFS transporter, ACS family, glucarate transporter